MLNPTLQQPLATFSDKMATTPRAGKHVGAGEPIKISSCRCCGVASWRQLSRERCYLVLGEYSQELQVIFDNAGSKLAQRWSSFDPALGQHVARCWEIAAGIIAVDSHQCRIAVSPGWVGGGDYQSMGVILRLAHLKPMIETLIHVASDYAI